MFTVTCRVNGITRLFSIRKTVTKTLINVVNYLNAGIDSFATPNILCKESRKIRLNKFIGGRWRQAGGRSFGRERANNTSSKLQPITFAPSMETGTVTPNCNADGDGGLLSL